MLVLIPVMVLFPVSSIFAHSPIFPGENHDIANAFQIENPSKSWVIYSTLEHHDKGDYYKFVVPKGERIYISLMTSEDPATSGFLPSFALMVPDSDEKGNLPPFIEVPDGYGIITVNGEDPGEAYYEPFTPGWLYELASISIDAPVDGTYYIVVYDSSQNTGNYGLPVGYVESFTIGEWIAIPITVQSTYIWEGQNIFIIYLPLILTIIIGGIILYFRSKKGRVPKGVSKWLAAFAGLAFIGTSLGLFYQMILAMTVTGFAAEAVITIIIAIIGIVLAIPSLLYAVREKPALTVGRRIGLAITGVFALFAWSGFFLGPALAVLAAVVPPYKTIKKWKDQATIEN
jgi:hypothetical protein